MNKTFKISVNNAFNFEISQEDVSKLDAVPVSDSDFHIINQNRSYKAEISESNFNSKAYKVKVNNNTYNVNIFNELDVLIKDMGFALGSTKNVNSIKAPMPGLILEIQVEADQEVKENDTLIILEAMKMENIITSPRDGIIKSITVKKGEAVEKNQLLIEFK